MSLQDYGFAPGVNLPDPLSLLAKPEWLKRLFNRIRPSVSISDATNDGNPIVVTTTTPHFIVDGDQVTISGVGGNTAANGSFKASVISPTTFSLPATVGNGDYVADTGSVILARRGQTIDRSKIGSLNELITFLESTTSIAKPIGNVYLGAHAGASGRLGLKMYRKQAFNEKKGVLTEYETLEDTFRPAPAPTLGLPPLPPLAQRTINVPADLVGDPTGRPQLFFDIRGCDIGRAEPFITKFKEALGGIVGVRASKHEHGVFEVSASTSDQYGSWEYYTYAFTVRRPGPRAAELDPPNTPTPIRSRDDLVTAFRTARELEGDPDEDDRFKFIDGTVVSDVTVGGQDDLWSKWVPSDVVSPKLEDLRVPIAPSIGNRTTLPLKWRLFVYPSPFIWQITYPNAGAVPKSEGRLAAFQQNLLEDPNHTRDPFNQNISRWSEDHPFPAYKREGYFTLEDFMGGFTWDVTNTVKLKNGNVRLDVLGSRIIYLMLVPVTNPNPGVDPSAANLLFNFFPNANSPNLPVMQIRQDDSRFLEIL